MTYANIRTLFHFILVIILCFLALFMPVHAAQNYIVGEGDVLEINVFGHDEMHSIVRVGADGTIMVPLLNKVEVGGLTTSQISDKLARLLADGYLISPQVSVFVKEYRNWKAVILGEVKKPGIQELTSQTTLLELISRAGGLTADAGHKAVIKRKIFKNGEKRTETLVIDLWKLLEEGDTTQNILIQDDDTIYIGKGGFFYITGQVKKPGSYKVTPDMTVIKAIALAGGFTDIASRDSVKIIRKTPAGKKELEDVPLDMKVNTEDVIVVPESIF